MLPSCLLDILGSIWFWNLFLWTFHLHILKCFAAACLLLIANAWLNSFFSHMRISLLLRRTGVICLGIGSIYLQIWSNCLLFFIFARGILRTRWAILQRSSGSIVSSCYELWCSWISCSNYLYISLGRAGDSWLQDFMWLIFLIHLLKLFLRYQIYLNYKVIRNVFSFKFLIWNYNLVKQILT